MFYNTENMTVSGFTNNVDHDHEWVDETDWGIPKSTKIKRIINECFDSGVVKPMLIMYKLRKRGIAEPKLRQLNNYLSVYKKKRHGRSEISYYDLENWCRARSEIPDDIHKVFVIGYFIQVDEVDSTKSIFRLAISTIFLLQLALKTSHLAENEEFRYH